jgi:hypothetical protein
MSPNLNGLSTWVRGQGARAERVPPRRLDTRAHRIAWLALLVASCNSQSRPIEPSATPSASPFADLKPLIGTFTLTIELDETCINLPPSARRRVYTVTAVDRGWHFVPISVVGGGFGAEQLLGEVFTGQLSPLRSTEPQLRWNAADIDCSVPERLDEVQSLAVCGEGPATATPSGFESLLTGVALVSRNGAVVGACTGQHRFSFVR